MRRNGTAFIPTHEVVKTHIGPRTRLLVPLTVDTAQKLYDELDYQRPVQADHWALTNGSMADEEHRLGAGDHAVILADNSADSRQWIITAN